MLAFDSNCNCSLRCGSTTHLTSSGGYSRPGSNPTPGPRGAQTMPLLLTPGFLCAHADRSKSGMLDEPAAASPVLGTSNRGRCRWACPQWRNEATQITWLAVGVVRGSPNVPARGVPARGVLPEVGSAGSEIVCQSNPSRESPASPKGASLLRGGCAPSSDPTAAGVSVHRRGSSGTLGCLASSFVPSSRFLSSFDCIVAKWHGRRLGSSTARSRCDFPTALPRLAAALPQRGAARPHVLAFTTRSRKQKTLP